VCLPFWSSPASPEWKILKAHVLFRREVLIWFPLGYANKATPFPERTCLRILYLCNSCSEKKQWFPFQGWPDTVRHDYHPRHMSNLPPCQKEWLHDASGELVATGAAKNVSQKATSTHQAYKILYVSSTKAYSMNTVPGAVTWWRFTSMRSYIKSPISVKHRRAFPSVPKVRVEPSGAVQFGQA